MKLLFNLILLFVLAPDLSMAQNTESQAQRLNRWFNEKFEQQLQSSPLLMTQFGRRDKYSQVDLLTEKEDEDRLEWMAGTVKELREKFNYNLLDEESQTSYDLWVYSYEQLREIDKFKTHHYVFSDRQKAFALLPPFLIRQHKVEEASDMEAYIDRIQGVSQGAMETMKRAERYVALGNRPPQFLYDDLLTHVDIFLTGVPFSESENLSPFWADILTKLDFLKQNKKIDDKGHQLLRARAQSSLVTHFKPAYESLREFFKREREQSPVNATGVSRHPDGVAYYNQRLAQHSTMNLNAEEVHRMGLREVARITKEMLEAKERLKFKGSLIDFFAYLKNSPQFYYPNTDPGRNSYIQATEDSLEAMMKRLPDFFGFLPKSKVLVKRVEPLLERAGASNHYTPGSIDGQKLGTFYLHLLEMKNRPKYLLEATAYHEGIPGHHLQSSIGMVIEELPLFRRLTTFTAFSEGWALYAEYLAKEMGGYKDGFSDFGRLTLEMWRSVRLVVDTGLHTKGWTEEQAVAFYKEKTPLSDDVILSEVRRHLIGPGRAVSYKVGMIKILEMREKAKKQLGSKFDIKTFHDTIIGGGALPLVLLEKRVERYIKKHKN